MIFNDYYNNVRNMLKQKQYNIDIANNNLNIIFTDYINDTPINECIKKLLANTLNENTQKTSHLKTYTRRVITLLETLGFKNTDITNDITTKISDSYDIGEDEYACAELCKNEIQRNQQYTPIKLTQQKINQVQNNLIINLHNINNAAFLKLNVSPSAATVKLKIRLLTNLKYIDTDVKSFIKTVHKYLIAFVNQNNNTELETNILSYSIKYNNLYCVSEIKIPLFGTQSDKFNIYDISKTIKSYLNVLETFCEQYKNIV